MICGIDLGTTNSLIGHGEGLYTGLVSSSVNVRTGKQTDRDDISGDVVSSYKVNMTTGSSGELPMKCSSVILRDLVNKASNRTGQIIEDIVVSVPAKFSHTQREAVWKAAEDAGLNIHGLINEPTAAALYVCRDVKDLIVVYDLGGGTFDVTILDSRIGSYYVIATDGDGHLAGDNLDNELAQIAAKEQKVPIRFRGKDNMRMLRTQMRKAKEAIQRSGLDQYIDMSFMGCTAEYKLTLDTYIKAMQEVFAPTIKLTNQLVRTYVPDNETPKLVFVGGSTACPYLRNWVLEQTGLEEIECSIMPDLIVAKGVALYAEMVENGKAAVEIEDVTKCLCVEDEAGRAEVIIEKNTIIPTVESKTFVNAKDTDHIEVNLYQGDSLICAENEYIGTLEFDYGEVRKAGDGLVEVEIAVDINGRITLSCLDVMTCESRSIDLVIK